MKIHSDIAWNIASRYSSVLASETRDLAAQIDAAIATERERCALIAIEFGAFPGGRLVKEMRAMCGNAIADKIRETVSLTPPDGKIAP